MLISILVLIQAVVHDPQASRDILDAYRRKLGLGPSNNLICSTERKRSITGDEEEPNVYRHPHFQEEASAPSLSTTDQVRLYDNVPDDSQDARRQREFTVKKTPAWGPKQHSSTSKVGLAPAPKYKGNPSLARNRCADIPDRLNCRLWITGLPPNCTVTELLGAIRGVGAIDGTHINPPKKATEPGETDIPTSAASLTFFSASSANQFLLWHSRNPFTVDGYTTSVVRHRVKTQSFPAGNQTRVLVIKGHPEVVNPEYLEYLFSRRWTIRYTTEFVEYRPGEETSEVVWAFGSFRAQAHEAYNGLNNHFADKVTVSYAPDPCA